MSVNKDRLGIRSTQLEHRICPGSSRVNQSSNVFCLLDGLNLASDSSEWHAKQPAGCESPRLPSFSLFKYVWHRPNFPLLTPLHFALPCSWTRFQMRNSIPSQSLKEGPSPVENIPINMWTLNYCAGAFLYSQQVLKLYVQRSFEVGFWVFFSL